MKTLKGLMVALALVMAMAGSIPAAENVTMMPVRLGSVIEFTISFETDASGNLTETTLSPGASGWIFLGIANPDDTNAPDANWNIVFKDKDGVPIFSTALDDLSATDSTEAEPLLGYRYVSGNWTFDVTDAGADMAKGLFRIYLLTSAK